MSSCCRKSQSRRPLVVGDSPDSASPGPDPFLELLDGCWEGEELVTEGGAVGVAEPFSGERCWLSCIESSLSLLLEPLELPENENFVSKGILVLTLALTLPGVKFCGM